MTEIETDPFDDYVDTYRSRGWTGTLPLTHGRKTAPPQGFTGELGVMPERHDIDEWRATGPHNIALRLPRNVIGIDVDDYGTKNGRATYFECLNRAGALPATWVSTSRPGAPLSGIRLFRLPPGVTSSYFRDPTHVGPDVEVIRFGHRYIVAAPSVHPDGGEYAWRTPDGTTVDAADLPSVGALPELPLAWCELLGGKTHEQYDDRGVELVDLGTISKHTDVTRPITSGHDNELSAWAASIVAKHSANVPYEALYAMILGRGSFCVPPWNDSMRPGDDTLEVRAHVWLRSALEKYGRPYIEPEIDPETGEIMPSALGSSWGMREIAEMDGSATDPPTFFRRSDGAGMFYAGETNGLIGESESGKSWLAQYACAQALSDGDRVLYVDFESRYPLIAERLVTLGIPRATLSERFRYIAPDEPLDANAQPHRNAAIEWCGTGVTVLDGVNAAMSVLGLDSNSTNDATRFHQLAMLPFTKAGACVVYVDHLAKHHGTVATPGAIGSQAKRAMTSGCTLRVKAIRKFGRGTPGMLSLTVDKDRGGFVRALCDGESEEVALFKVEPSLIEGAAMSCRLEPPMGAAGKEFIKEDRIVTLESRIIKAIEQENGPSQADIAAITGVRKEDVVEAIGRLIDAGRVSRAKDGKSFRHYLDTKSDR